MWVGLDKLTSSTKAGRRSQAQVSTGQSILQFLDPNHQGARNEDLLPKSPPFWGNSQLGKGMVFFNTWEEKTHGFSILPEIDFHPRKTNSHFTPDIEMMVGLLTDPFLFEMVPFFRVGIGSSFSLALRSYSGEPGCLSFSGGGWQYMAACVKIGEGMPKISCIFLLFFMSKLEVLVKSLGISGL